MSLRDIEKKTHKAISDTAAGKILDRLFASNLGYRIACKDGSIESHVKAFDGGLRALGAIDTTTLAKTLDENGKLIRTGRRSKPVEDEE